MASHLLNKFCYRNLEFVNTMLSRTLSFKFYLVFFNKNCLESVAERKAASTDTLAICGIKLYFLFIPYTAIS